MKDVSEKSQLVSNIFSLSILQGTNYILPLITFPYLVRVIGIDNFGLVSFVQAFIMYFNIIVDYGFSLSATREISLHKGDMEKVSSIFNSVMMVKLFMTLLSFCLFCLFVFFTVDSEKDSKMYLMGFTMVVGQALFPIWFFQGMEKMKHITYINLVTKIIFLLALFVFIRKPDDYVYVLLINGLGLIVSGLISLYIIYNNFQIKLKISSFSSLIEQLVKGWDLFIATAFSSMYRNINIIILGLFASNVVVGYYAIAEKIIKIIQSLQVPIGQALYPYLSRKFKNLNNFNFHRKYFMKVLCVYLFIAIALFVFAPFITHIVSGSYLKNVIFDLRILSVIIVLGGLNYYFGVLGLLTMGYQKEFSKLILMTGVFNTVIVAFLAYLYKDVGVAISLVLSELFLLSLILLFVKKVLRNIEKDNNV